MVAIFCGYIYVYTLKNASVAVLGVSRRRGTAFRAPRLRCWKMLWSGRHRSCLNSRRTYCTSWQQRWTLTLWWMPAYRSVFILVKTI